MADSLSKSNYSEMRAIMRQSKIFARRAPAALINWVKDPKPDRDLWEKILDDMSTTTRLLNRSRKRKSRWDN